MEKIAQRRALVYARVSRDVNERASVTDQRTAGIEVCEEFGWTVAGVAEDNDRSASRFARKDRPGWAEVQASVQSGLIDMIVLWETSRGDRKLREWAAFLDDCRDRNVAIHVISHDRTYDLRRAQDWRTLANDGVDAAHESNRLSGRIKRGIAGAALRGQPYASTPYGYKRVYDPDTGKFATLEPEPAQAPIIAEIIRRAGRHESIHRIRDDLDARGIPSPTGGTWDAGTIRYLVRNPVYAARLRTQDGSLVKGTWPPIVDDQTWKDAVAVLTSRAGKRAGVRPGKQRHLLTHTARCRECGQIVVAKKVRGQDTYCCRDGCFYAPYEWLNDWVAEVICARLARPDARDLFKSDDKRSAELDIKLTELERRHEEFCVKAARGKLSATALELIEEELLPDIAKVRRELNALSLPPALREILTAPDVRPAWDGMDVRAQRAILATVTGVLVGKAAAHGRSGRARTG